MDKITRDKTSIINHYQNTKLLGLRHPSLSERKLTKSRCRNKTEIENFSNLKPDDLALLTILFQNLEKNIFEYENILHDIRHIGKYITELNKKPFLFNSLNNQQDRLTTMINTLSIIELFFILKIKNCFFEIKFYFI
jgi:hypothetical protein